MMDDLSLRNVNDKLPSDAMCSFRVDTTGASSLIDHIFVSIPLYELLASVETAALRNLSSIFDLILTHALAAVVWKGSKLSEI